MKTSSLVSFAVAFNIAFNRHEDCNRCSLVILRNAMPQYNRKEFDESLNELRRYGQFCLSGAEGRYGLTDEEIASAIREDDRVLLYVHRRT